MIINPDDEVRDMRDAMIYGVCWCGRPIRARMSRSATDGYSWASCDEGHGMNPGVMPVQL
jgi:hypothetical protein